MLLKFLAVLLACGVLLSACGEPSEARFSLVDVTGADYNADFRLTDHTGQPRSLADFRGKVVTVFFGFTQCPDVCPTALSTMAQTMKLLGEDAQRVQVLFITVDPERDTRELLSQYVPAFHPSFVGLYGNADETAAVAKNFRVFYRKNPGSTPDTYTMDHTAGTYVFDPEGRLRLYARHGETPEVLAGDIRKLLAGG